MSNVRKTITSSLGSINDQDLFEFLDEMEGEGMTVSKLVKDALRFYKNNYIHKKETTKENVNIENIEEVIEETVERVLLRVLKENKTLIQEDKEHVNHIGDEEASSIGMTKAEDIYDEITADEELNKKEDIQPSPDKQEKNTEISNEELEEASATQIEESKQGTKDNKEDQNDEKSTQEQGDTQDLEDFVSSMIIIK